MHSVVQGLCVLKRDDGLVGFLEHDTVGLLVLADRDDWIGELARKLQGTPA